MRSASTYDRPVIVAGTGLNAQVISSFIEGAGAGTIAAYTIDGDHIETPEYLGRPVVPVERLSTLYPPDRHYVVNTIGFNRMNDTRARISAIVRRQGFTMPGFIHPTAIIDETARFGSNLIAVQGVIVEPFVVLGDDVTLWSGCYVGHHSAIGSNVYIGPRATVPGTVVIEDNAFIGANATIRSKITIGARCLIGAASYVHEDTPSRTVLKARGAVRSRRTSDDFDYFH